MTKKILSTITLTLALYTAQSQQIYFSGVGRALFSTENLTDQTSDATGMRASGGYSALDLGIYAEPDDVLRANVILRQRNEFGGFFDNGTSLEFRQMQLEGIIAKSVKYELGDIYIAHTPYTVFNSDPIYNGFESKLFSVRRDIVNYENFYVDNNWMMQGFNTESALNFEKGIESAGIRVYGGRTRPTNFLTVPDRYFFGGRLNMIQSENLEIGGNIAGLSDIKGTIENTQVAYNNQVVTGDFNYGIPVGEKLKFGVNGELGGSNFKLERVSDSTMSTFDDIFYDLGASAAYLPMNLVFNVNYRNVGYNFSSPMAQTRRMTQPGDFSLTYFPTLNDENVARNLSFYDRYASEANLYNRSISATLMDYYVQYDMVEPYGKATPNRQGLTASIEAGSMDSLFYAQFEANLLSEGTSEGDSIDFAKRDFTLMRGGLTFNANHLIGWENELSLSVGARLESATRAGTNPVDLSSSLIDLGLDVEVFKNLHLMVGAKMFAVSGDEMVASRNAINEITAFTPVSFDEKQNIYAAGLQYDYDKKAYFALQGNMVAFDDANAATTNYEMNQLFMVFGVKF